MIQNIFLSGVLLLMLGQSIAFAAGGGSSASDALPKSNKIAADLGPSYSKEEMPYAPSYLTVKTDGHKKLTPELWTDPEICAQCHPRQYEGWNGSMHSNAFNDPVFQALWAIGEKETGGKLLNHCGACHSPIGVATGTIKFNPDEGLHGTFTAPPIAAKGISCDVCHTISGTNLDKTKVMEHGNSSIIMEPGNVKRATLKDAVSPFHETEYSPIHQSSEFCGNCHNIFHPDNNFPVEHTYDEWKYSIYAQNGIQCMDCHMVPVDTAIRVADELKRPKDLNNSMLGGFVGIGGPYRDIVHDHAFVGGNAVVTEVMNGEKTGSSEEAMKRLKSVASLEMSIQPQDGMLHQLTVRVNNDRAGHNLPTSLTETRQIWLEVLVVGDNGQVLLRSGSLQQNNELPEGTVIFNSEAVDINGKHTEKPWEVTRFLRSNTIPPKGFKEANYAFNLPADSKTIKVISKLHYRSFSQGLADLLLGKDAIHVPSVNMVTNEHSYVVSNGQIKTASIDASHH